MSHITDTKGTTESGFRPDLEGLRGVAILFVLLFHAGLAGIGGGFIGVDVFFVLSGFLITGLLVREQERNGRISLPRFYARRARRILPAAAIVLVITLAAAALVAAPLDLPRFADDAVAAALSGGNIRFAAQGMDYFAAGDTPSPFLHYWSLGVEEQFYFIWPALLILAIRFGHPRRNAGIVLLATLIASFVVSLWLTDSAAPWAFYSLPARAWQLAAGGLLAVIPALVTRAWAGRALVVGGWLGLAAVIASATVLIDASTPYPGLAALLPTFGTVAIVAAGMRKRSPGSLLALAPLRFLGRISFSLYLVHWPLLVLPAAGLPLGVELPFEARIGLVFASVLLAYVSWRFIEEPFRRGRTTSAVADRPFAQARTLGLAGGSVALTAILALAISFNAVAALDAPVASGSDGFVAVAAPTDLDPAPEDTAPPDVEVIDPDTSPDLSPDPTLDPGATPDVTPGTTAPPSPTVTLPAFPLVGRGGLPGDVTPRLSGAAADWERIKADGCEMAESGLRPKGGCVYGDKNGTLTVALVGDSHAGQWFPALDIIARQNHWKLIPMVKFSCRFTDIRQYSRVLKREYTECETWISAVVDKLHDIKPDLTVVAWTRSPGVMIDADNSPARQGAGTARLLADVTGKVALLVDTPQSIYNVPSCLSSHKSAIESCSTARSTAFGWRYLQAERAAAKALGARATVVNLTDWICPGKTCPAVLDGHIVYRDDHHLTATFAASLSPVLAAKLPKIAP